MNEFNGLPPKQINRVVTPIKVNEVGNNELKNEVSKPPKSSNNKNRQPSKNMFFIVILLIILAILCFIIFYFIIPKYLESNEKLEYNDATTTTQNNINNIFSTVEINNRQVITTSSTFEINSNYQISTNLNGDILDVFVNNKKITSANYLLPVIGKVDDLILFTVQNKLERTTKLYSVDKEGNIVLEIYNIGNVDGMVLLPDSSSIIYNTVSLVLLASRVNNNTLFLNNEISSNNGINICNEDELLKNKLNDNSIALATFSIEYLGNHKFSKPIAINSVSIKNYKETKNVCR